MPSSLSPVVIFREAALHSGLVQQLQWTSALDEAKQKGTTADEELSSRQLCDRIAEILIRDEVVTSYQAQQLQSGRTKLTLGSYLVTEFLGQGGMGQVFVGVHEVMGRKCAIKVLPLQKSNALARESFAREIRLQATLDCPYLVRAFDAGRDGNVHFLVTEYVPGTDLRRLVKDLAKKDERLSMQQSASIIAQAAAGLAYAHESGLIHRDVKPANLLVTPDGHAKVADIGLAALTFGVDDDPRAGKIVGTADYLSPEQIRTPKQIGPQSDLYSLGCTLYYACTAKLPFPGGDSKSKCRRHLHESPLDPRHHAPELSEAFVETIGDMLEKDATRRIQTAAEVVERLSPWAAMDAPTIILPSGVASGMNQPGGSIPSSSSDDEEWLVEAGLVDPPKISGAAKWRVPSGDSSIGNSRDNELNLDESPPSSTALSGVSAIAPPVPGTAKSNVTIVPNETLAQFNTPAMNSVTPAEPVAVPPPIASPIPVVTRRKLIKCLLLATAFAISVGFAAGYFYAQNF